VGDRSTRSGRRALLAAVSFVLLVTVAACGGGDDEGGGGGGGGDESTAPGESSFEYTNLEPDTAEPQYGGEIVYGIEADTDNGWITTDFLCAVSCGQVIRSVYDPLMELDEEGNAVPYLLESITPNDDFTEWTLVTREGITFHDGTPFDAEAVVRNLNAHQTSLITARAVQDSNPAEVVDERTVRITTKVPWVNFPIGLTSQVGYMASPTWLDAVDAGTAESDEPVGTGPFVFESYSPGGDFVATRNEEYWQSDPDGNQLPYLDKVTFRIFNDSAARERALVTGDIDIMHVAQGQVISDLRDSDEVELVETSQGAEVTYMMLNSAAPGSALADVEVRRALAQAIDREQFTEARSDGVMPVANGPFSPDVDGWLEDTGFPEYDPEAAEAAIAAWEEENGDMVINLKTTNDQNNRATVELAASLWEQIGVTTEIDQVEQGQFVLDAANGQFEAITFRNLGGVDADQRQPFLDSATSGPVGSLAINFNRIEDPIIDEALATIRSDPDEDARRTAAEDLNRQMAAEVYDIWLSWQVWGIGYQPDLHQVATGALAPDGDPLIGLRPGGNHQLSQIWVDG
jgi:peptide/nickel transport system substrate-binding protein